MVCAVKKRRHSCISKTLLGLSALYIGLTLGFTASVEARTRSPGACIIDTLKKFPALKKRAKSSTFWTSQEPVSEKVSKGQSLEDALKTKRRNDDSRISYDAKTGHLLANRKTPLRLSLENGDAELDTLRMNWPKTRLQLAEKHLEGLVEAMKELPNLRLLIVAGEDRVQDAQRAVTRIPKQYRSRITIQKVDGKGANVWAQDGSKPLEGLHRTAVPANMVGRTENHQKGVLATLNKVGAVKTLKSKFIFDGGNVVVGENHIFVGPDIVQANSRNLGISYQETLDALAVEFGKPVIQVGVPGFDGIPAQLDFHIDLTMAVVRDHQSGREVILLDSPRKGLEALAEGVPLKELPTDPSQFFRELLRRGLDRQGRPAITNGEKALEEELLRVAGRGGKESSSQVKGLESAFIERETAVQALAKGFEELGYKVVWLPGLNFGFFDKGSRAIGPTVFNYTNAIFSGHHAIVPEMGVRVLDKAAADQIKALGYSVIPAPVTERSICMQGGVRCMSETYRAPLKKAPQRSK